YGKTKRLLMEKKQQVEKLAEALLEKEVLFQSDVESLIGKRPYEEKKKLESDETKPTPGEISAGVPPYDSDITNKALP
ncbi:MAG TPA: AAA family ATPase, partial [Chitinophagaceae bacterium]|nr:AAA family ATPase [Chitinophagaceae bacterium]